jgi:hypothetical protein
MYASVNYFNVVFFYCFTEIKSMMALIILKIKMVAQAGIIYISFHLLLLFLIFAEAESTRMITTKIAIEKENIKIVKREKDLLKVDRAPEVMTNIHGHVAIGPPTARRGTGMTEEGNEVAVVIDQDLMIEVIVIVTAIGTKTGTGTGIRGGVGVGPLRKAMKERRREMQR